jgi:parallel beta-helix repeat protein
MQSQKERKMVNSKKVFAAVLCLSLAQAGLTATYYVDFDGGADSTSGTSPAQAFKHCPGDRAAEKNAQQLALKPGDSVILKGGVIYRGSISIPAGGEAGLPVVFDGNTAGTFGQGRAIVDGSELISGWRRCVSAAECEGNPNWQNIYTAVIPAEVNPVSANLFEDGRMAWVAQDPNLIDPFYMDDLKTFSAVKPQQITVSTITDPARFIQTDAQAWDGTTVLVWGTPNFVYLRQITGYDPATATVTLDPVPGVYTNRDSLYAVANHIRLLDVPGESVISTKTDAEGRRKIYYWPQEPGDINQKKITFSIRESGIDLNGKSHVILQGFIIQKQGGEKASALSNSTGVKASDVTVRDNEIRWNRSRERSNAVSLPNLEQARIEGNRVYENVRARGLAFNDNTGLVVSNNTLHKNGGTGIAFFGCRNSQMINNTVTAHNGVHANALTVYAGSADVLVSGNKVFDSNIALTTQASTNITIACNILTGREGYIFADWDKCDRLNIYNNVILGDQGNCAVTVGTGTKNIIFKNNICNGHALNRIKNGTPDMGNNIYTDVSFVQKSLEPGSRKIPNLSSIFADPEKRDYRLKKDSPAIDAGTAVGISTDITGRAVPQGEAPDIGAYEYSSDDE